MEHPDLRHLDGTDRLFFRGGDKKIENYILTWLKSPRNHYFLAWNKHSGGPDDIYYLELTDSMTLSAYLKNPIRAKEYDFLLMAICRALIFLDASLMDSHGLVLNMDYVYLFPGTERNLSKGELPYKVKFVYLPYLQSEVSANVLDREAFWQILINKYLDLNKSAKKKEAKTWLDKIYDGEEQILSTLEAKYQKKESKKQLSAERPRIFSTGNLPIILMTGEILILLTLYGINYFLGHIPVLLLCILLSLIVFILFLQLRLLLNPASPFYWKAFQEVERKNTVASRKHALESVKHKADKTLIEANPGGKLRLANLTLLSSGLGQEKELSWQIYQEDFILGTDEKKADLFLPLRGEESAGPVLRICQRQGSFYCQALSSTVNSYLKDRLLYRYEDYLMPDECILKIQKLIFRFRAY